MSVQREFSRYLYDIKHIRYSLLTTLVANTQSENVYKHCIFYASEYYYSRSPDELWDFLFKIYYDFFIVYNPTFEKTMISRRKKFQKTKDVGLVVFVIHNLFHFKAYEGLFILNRVVKQRTSKQKYTYESYMEDWPIHKTKHSNIELGLIKKLVDGKFIESIKYCKKLYEAKPRKTIAIIEKFIGKKMNKYTTYAIEKCIYEVYTKFFPEKFKKTNLVKPKIAFVNLFIKLNDVNTIRNWQILSKKRRGVCKNIGCFSDVFEQTNADLYNWKNYVLTSPIWKERYIKHNGVLIDDEKKYEFKSKKDLINFESEFEYEIDEQKKYTRNHSSFKIKDISMHDWLSSTFWNNKNEEYADCKQYFKTKIQY